MSKLGDFFRGLMGPDERYEAERLMELRATQAFGILPASQTGKPRYPKREISTYEDEGYAKLALIFRCVGLTSQLAGTAPVRVYQEDNEGNKTTLPRHPMRQLMRRPNLYMGESRFISYVTLLTSVAGFCVVEKERDRLGNVIGLWPLEPNRCRAILRSQRPPDWEYTISASNKVVLKSEDVLHFTYADKPGSPYGTAPMEVAFREVGILNQMIDFLLGFFQNGAMPVYALIPDLQPGQTMDQAKADAIKSKWSRRHAGLQNSIDPAILAGIKDLKRLSFDFSELAYTDLRTLSDLAICQAFGIDPSMVGTMIGMEKSTYSNKEEARKGCYQDTIIPLWSRFDDTLELGLLSEFVTGSTEFARTGTTISLEFDISKIQALQENRNEKAGWLTTAALGSLISAHTYAAELGLPKPEGPDYYLRSIATEAIPVDDPLGESLALPVPKASAQVVDPKALPAGEPDPSQEPRGGVIAYDTRYGAGPSERRAKIGALNKKHIRRIGDRATPMMATFFTQQGKRIIRKAARSSEMDIETREAAIDWDYEEKQLTKILRSIYKLAGETATDAVNQQFGVSLDFDLANPKLDDFRSMLAHQVKDITATTRDAIQTTITEATKSGKTVDDIAIELESQFGAWSRGRAEVVARTESQKSFNGATIVATRESGVCEKMQLFDNPDHDTDPGSDGLTCAGRNLLIVDLDKAQSHSDAEHPNGTLAMAGVLTGED